MMGTDTVFDVTGAQIGQFYSASEGTITLPREYGNIGRIEVEANSVAEARISNISFESINLDNTAPAVAPMGITINSIAPGRIRTPMAAGVSDEVWEQAARQYAEPALAALLLLANSLQAAPPPPGD